MRAVSKFALAASLAGVVAVLAGPAVAGCKRMGFLVNDYGKEGPTNDAKALLDKHIATWAAEQGIEKYTVGKKEVKCELFLNLIVVDEHTCTASATVCWGNDKIPASAQDASTDGAASKPKKAKKAVTAKAADTKPAEDAVAEQKPAEEKAADAKLETEKAQDAKPEGEKADEAKSTETATETSAPTKVETGALPVTNKPAEDSSASEAADDQKAAASSASPDTASSSAAEAAAAAAERAAAAAERAAAAAERAAAALAASNANVPVPPGAAKAAAASAQSAPATVAPIRGTTEAEDKPE